MLKGSEVAEAFWQSHQEVAVRNLQLLESCEVAKAFWEGRQAAAVVGFRV